MHRIHDEIEALSKSAKLTWLPCGPGRMPVRSWPPEPDPTREHVLFLHGGSGSWMHWVRNVDVLSQAFNCHAMDLPGLGDADMCEEASRIESAARTLRFAIESFLDQPFHVVAFSWGCTLTSVVLREIEDNVKSVMLTGPASVGDVPVKSGMKQLIRRTPDMTEQEIYDAQRTNLSRLMIHDENRIDDLAVWIQQDNTSRARFNSRQYVRSTHVLDGLADTSVPLYIIYGEFDGPAWPEVDEREAILKGARQDARFEIVPGAGHWLQYETPQIFNARCREWLTAHSN